MSRDSDALRTLTAEIAHTGRLVPGTVEDWTRRACNFERWHEQNNDAGVIDESAVLGYLLARGHQAWGTLRTDVQAIDWYYSRSESGSPVGPLIRLFLRDKWMREGRSRLPKVRPLLINQAVQIAETLDESGGAAAGSDPMISALRTIITTARRTADPGRQIGITLDLLVHPDALKGCTGPGGPDLPSLQVRARGRLRAALGRTRIAPTARVGELREDQWEWLWANADPGTYRRVRDLGYLLVGLSHARRHVELRTAEIQHVYDDGDGYLVWYGRTKNGDDHCATASHLSDNPKDCPAECPACALAALLDYADVCQGRKTGPLFATYYAGQYRPMSRQNGRHRILRMTKAAFGSAWGSTRSFRSGAATSAARAGWTVQQIATLTGHRDLNQVEGYVDRSDAPSGTLQLDLDD